MSISYISATILIAAFSRRLLSLYTIGSRTYIPLLPHPLWVPTTNFSYLSKLLDPQILKSGEHGGDFFTHFPIGSISGTKLHSQEKCAGRTATVSLRTDRLMTIPLLYVHHVIVPPIDRWAEEMLDNSGDVDVPKQQW